MTADIVVLERIFDRLARTLAAGGPDQFAAPFRVAEIIHALVPYRTYRHELGTDTLQDYEHAVLQLLAGERGYLVCDPDTVAVIKKELASPDPDTGLVQRLGTAQVRMGAIRMPVQMDVRKPIARPEEDARDAATDERRAVSDAFAMGAVMNFDDSDLANLAELPASALPPASASTTASTPAPVVSSVEETPPVTTAASEPAPSTSSEARASAPEAAAVPAWAQMAAPLASLNDLPMLTQVPPPTTPLQSVHGVTLPNPQQLSRITPLSVPSLYGDPIEFRGVRHAPVDVGGVIFLFGMVARELGFNVEAMTSGFPRCEAKRQMSPGKWQRLRIDFEHESRQFRDAGRNPSACDLIVCWRDTWPDRPSSLDVLSLERILPTLASREQHA
jgi:hypothetical protein